MFVLHAIAGSLVTSIVPALLLLALPRGGIPPRSLRLMLAFAAGALLGDVLLHMIPGLFHGAHEQHEHHHHDDHHGHETHPSNDSHGHSHGNCDAMLYVLLGIAVFYLIDGIVATFRGDDKDGHGHTHGQGTSFDSAQRTAKGEASPLERKPSASNVLRKRKGTGARATNESEPTPDDEAVEKKAPAPTKSDTSAWLNLIADTVHNVSDGFVIGASFLSATPTLGYRATMLVLVHEVPHELGDFAVLKSCGWSTRKIVLFQGFTALGNLFGTVAVLALGTAVERAKEYITPIAAGSFLYVALVSVLSDLNNQTKSLSERFQHTLVFALGVFALHQVIWGSRTETSAELVGRRRT